MNRASVFEWHKRFKEGRDSVRDDERCGWSKEVNTAEFIGQKVRVKVTTLRFYGSSGRDSIGRAQKPKLQTNNVTNYVENQLDGLVKNFTAWLTSADYSLKNKKSIKDSSCDVVANTLRCDIVESDFKF